MFLGPPRLPWPLDLIALFLWAALPWLLLGAGLVCAVALGCLIGQVFGWVALPIAAALILAVLVMHHDRNVGR